MEKVLLVEDDPELAEALVSILKKAGYDAVHRENGALGWDYLREQEPPDLALFDVRMPVMDGLELCRRLREDSRLRTLPVLLLTAMASSSEQADGYEIGADDFLAKPFDTDVLLARLKALKRRACRTPV